MATSDDKEKRRFDAPGTHEQAIKLADYIFSQDDPRQTMIDIFDLIDWDKLAARHTTPGQRLADIQIAER